MRWQRDEPATVQQQGFRNRVIVSGSVTRSAAACDGLLICARCLARFGGGGFDSCSSFPSALDTQKKLLHNLVSLLLAQFARAGKHTAGGAVQPEGNFKGERAAGNRSTGSTQVDLV